jgi:DNA replicative helicase MCM subunit Mcm2 (Cdc46/Mcm family)
MLFTPCLRQDQLNSLVKVGGVVTRRGGVWPMLNWVKFDCQKCGQVLGPFTQEGEGEIQVGHCFNCQSRISPLSQSPLFSPTKFLCAFTLGGRC